VAEKETEKPAAKEEEPKPAAEDEKNIQLSEEIGVSPIQAAGPVDLIDQAAVQVEESSETERRHRH
jgi:hypothetical protein